MSINARMSHALHLHLMKNILIIGGLVLVLLIGGAWWSRNLQTSDPDVVSHSGLHWHPRLEIYVKSVKQDIPAGIGLGAVHLPMHTHVEDAPQGVIHLEFNGLVRNEDLMLKHFFVNWGKDMRQFGETIHMSVNDVESTDYENYVLRDGDRVKLSYE